MRYNKEMIADEKGLILDLHGRDLRQRQVGAV